MSRCDKGECASYFEHVKEGFSWMSEGDKLSTVVSLIEAYPRPCGLLCRALIEANNELIEYEERVS